MRARTGLLALLAALALALSHGGSARAQQTCFGANCSSPNPEPSPATGTGNWVRATSPTLDGTVTLSSGATMVLPLTTFASQGGIVYKSANRWLHDYNYGNNGTVTTDGLNTFLGRNSGNFTMGSTATLVTQASRNTGIGSAVLFSNTTGRENVSIGASSLLFNTSGSFNVAAGVSALNANTSGNYNTAVGIYAMALNDQGIGNVAIGDYALRDFAPGSAVGYNTALGSNTARGITTGVKNTVLGAQVQGLPAALSNNIIIADGDGQQRIRAFPSLALTEGGGAETVLTLTSTTTNSFTVDVDYMVKATDATPDYAVRKGSVGLVCVNNATAVTCTASATDQTNDGRNGGGSLLINTNAKTLTYAIAVDVATANVAKITFNIDSDMTVTAAGITMVVTVNGIVTPS